MRGEVSYSCMDWIGSGFLHLPAPRRYPEPLPVHIMAKGLQQVLLALCSHNAPLRSSVGSPCPKLLPEGEEITPAQPFYAKLIHPRCRCWPALAMLFAAWLVPTGKVLDSAANAAGAEPERCLARSLPDRKGLRGCYNVYKYK